MFTRSRLCYRRAFIKFCCYFPEFFYFCTNLTYGLLLPKLRLIWSVRTKMVWRWDFYRSISFCVQCNLFDNVLLLRTGWKVGIFFLYIQGVPERRDGALIFNNYPGNRYFFLFFSDLKIWWSGILLWMISQVNNKQNLYNFISKFKIQLCWRRGQTKVRNPPFESSIRRSMARFQQTVSVHEMSRSGKPRSKQKKKNSECALNYTKEEQGMSIRKHSFQLNMSQTSLWGGIYISLPIKSRW